MKYSARPSRPRWPRRVLWVVGIAIVVLVSVTVVMRHVYDENLKPASSSSRSVTVSIAPGSSAKSIGTKLKTLGLIRSSWAFEWYVSSKEVRDGLQAGT